MGRVLAADFETTTDPADCRVWAWGLEDVGFPGTFRYGNDIHAFFQYLSAMDNDVDAVWFHNLAFDGKFIIYELLLNGYVWVDERRPRREEFTTLISNKGKFYQIVVNLGGRYITFKDSLKLLPLSIAAIAKTFNLPESKGEIDYDAYRAPGHALTSEEVDYLRRDVDILSQALQVNFSEGLTKLTIGSNAFGWFQHDMGKREFQKAFPALDDDTDMFIRAAYRGGFTYCNPDHAGETLSGISVDYNSMYPSMMVKYPYPIGEAIPFEGEYQADGEHPLYVQKMLVLFYLKPDGIPCIQLRGRGFYGLHEYVRETVEPVHITVTSVDWEVMRRMYDVDVLAWEGGYKFAEKRGIFDSYIEHWGAIKSHAKGGRRQLAKLMLNNLYGKFATNPDVTQKVPQLEGDGIVHYRLGEPEEKPGVYIPVGVFCTAYARRELLFAIMENRDRFIYCDTDSMHLMGDADPDGIALDDSKLCAWKVEGHFTRAVHWRAKCYIWEMGDGITVTCAGMPQNVKDLCTFENFRDGFTNVRPDGTIPKGAGKLIPKDVPGGVVLTERPYTLKI